MHLVAKCFKRFVLKMCFDQVVLFKRFIHKRLKLLIEKKNCFLVQIDKPFAILVIYFGYRINTAQKRSVLFSSIKQNVQQYDVLVWDDYHNYIKTTFKTNKNV